MNIQVDPTSSNLASVMLNSKIRPRAVVGYGVKIFHPSPPNYVTRSPGSFKTMKSFSRCLDEEKKLSNWLSSGQNNDVESSHVIRNRKNYESRKDNHKTKQSEMERQTYDEVSNIADFIRFVVNLDRFLKLLDSRKK